MEEKVLSIDDLKHQALAMFATLQGKRKALPAHLTDELDKEADRCTGPAVHSLRSNRIFQKRILDTLHHNKYSAQEPLAIFMFLLLDQCKDMAALKTLETLGSQMMWIPQSELGEIRLPPSSHLPVIQQKEVGRIYVRVEIFLTQAEDTKRFDMCVLDPDGLIPATERDLSALQRRMHAQTGVPMEVLTELTEMIRRDPVAVLDAMSSRVDMRRALAMDMEMMRVCTTCKRYGYNLSKCSGCKGDCSVYYCGQECQKSDWKIHKLKCGKPL
jgi:hypothetical protein